MLALSASSLNASVQVSTATRRTTNLDATPPVGPRSTDPKRPRAAETKNRYSLDVFSKSISLATRASRLGVAIPVKDYRPDRIDVGRGKARGFKALRRFNKKSARTLDKNGVSGLAHPAVARYQSIERTPWRRRIPELFSKTFASRSKCEIEPKKALPQRLRRLSLISKCWP